jgi:hypothetical protein
MGVTNVLYSYGFDYSNPTSRTRWKASSIRPAR